MAGIGFSLQRLFEKKGILNLCRAYGYAGIITAGPMLLGVALLLGVSFVSRIGGMDGNDRELLNCMLTYTLLLSLTCTSFFNMGVTRFTADMLYQEKDDRIMMSFLGVCSIMVTFGTVVYGIFLVFSGAGLLRGILCLCFLTILIIVWTEMIYLTALKDYKMIVIAFCISLLFGFLLALLLILSGYCSLETMLCSVITAYGILACWYFKLLLDYFPERQGSHFYFLKWIGKYKRLVLAGTCLNVGLFSHLVIMYFGPLREQVKGLFYGAPQYDIPALFAFFSILITTVSFVTSVEVRFYPKYRNYYGLFNDTGAIRDIRHAEREMLTVLRQELTFLGHKQIFMTILFIVIVPVLMESLPLGISNLSISIFRFLCVGYGAYASANSIMLILLYFEDYMGALAGTILFAVVSTGGTIFQIRYGSTRYFGAAFALAAILFYFCCVFRLNWYTKHLPYYLLSRQSIIPRSEKGFLVRFGQYLENRQLKKNARHLAWFLILAGSLVFMPSRSEAAGTVPGYEKEEVTEGNIHDNERLYENDDISSVITMHLTVTPGNEADSSNHTWTEVNAYSAYYYEELGIPRYKTEGILTIDEGEGITEESFGYGETVPNVSVQVRGQTSTKNAQKNYKIRIKDGKGSFRGQRTLALNKHKSIPYRFTNKLAYDLLKDIPQLFSAQTQFVHLYVTDLTAGGKGVEEDYGIYVMVEQLNKTYLERHGLDKKGGFYKINFFEWGLYDAVMKLSDAPDYDREEFEQYLEIKGNDDHTLLQEVMEKVNNYQIPITNIIEQHFNVENLVYWMGFQILIGNYDSGARNLFLYNPQNSERFYIISWDMDASFLADYHKKIGRIEGMSWESGMTLYLGQVLFRRMLKEERYRTALTEAILDLKENYVTKERVAELVSIYKEVMEPYLFVLPDEEYMQLDRQEYEILTGQIPDLVDQYYENYLESLERPWPFFVGEPVTDEEGTELTWDISYDMDGEAVTYDYWLSSDSDFSVILAEGHDLNIPYTRIGHLKAGEYYLKVTATNESGYTTDCFDYHKSSSGKGKIYGCYYFKLDEKGRVISK